MTKAATLRQFGAQLGRLLRAPQIPLRGRAGAGLKWLKFAALAAIAVNVAIAASAALDATVADASKAGRATAAIARTDAKEQAL